MTIRTGLLGGAFNPPHYGHLHPAHEAMKQLGLARLVFIPSGLHPFKGPEQLAPVTHRLAMLRLALAGWERCDIWEIEARAPHVSYTVETLQAWHQCHPDEEPVLLIGADIASELHLWRDWQQLMQLAHIVLLTRPGFDCTHGATRPAMAHLECFRVHAMADLDCQRLGRYGFFQLPVTLMEIASTDLRRRLQAGESLDGLTPDAVIAYARTHALYGSTMPASLPTPGEKQP